VTYHDPHCPVVLDDGHTALSSLPMRSVELTEETLAESDVVVVVTDHTAVDYARVAEHARLVVDTRGAMRGVASKSRMVGLSLQGVAAPSPGARLAS
jgi:UDP-N-acetyl-D-glucosamine dehydrogenase